MKYIKNICFMLFITICFLFILITDSYAEQDTSFCCGTDPQLVQELHNELIQRKTEELNQQYSPWSNEISLFSTINDARKRKGGMPSTGNVKALVLTVSFPNAPLTDEHFSQLTEDLIGEHSNTDASKYYSHHDERSVKEIYRDMSNGKLNFDADIMPIYNAENHQYWYSQNDKDLNGLITEILTYHKNNGTIKSFSDYDSDRDGSIDCLVLIFNSYTNDEEKIQESGQFTWQNNMQGTAGIDMSKICDENIKLSYRAQIGIITPNDKWIKFGDNRYMFIHECMHLMGLYDNYLAYGSENDLYGINELMCANLGHGYVLNPYYRYILDWIEPKILPYTENIETINLASYENPNDTENEQAIILIPDNVLLPFSEYYMIEYRQDLQRESLYTAKPGDTNGYGDRHVDGGVILWHINSEIHSGYSYSNPKNYIKPVYKNGGNTSSSGTVSYTEEDIYRTGDIWSSTTSPSSDFYNGFKTGAYLKVTDMDDEKATIEVGFQDMNWEQPTVAITGKNEYTKDYGRVCFTLAYNDVYSMMGNMPTDSIGGKYLSQETIDKYVSIETTGNIQAQIDYENCLLNNKNQIVIWVKGIDKDAIEGEGTVQLHLKEGSAINGFKKCEAASSPVVEISELDKTPPKVEVTYFPPWRTKGKVIAFFQADEEITPTEYVFTKNQNLAGVGVYDLAGNATYLNLRVNWISTFWDEDYKTLPPEGVFRYSTQSATNQDVTVQLEPLEDVKESSEELTHVFTDNGEYTFTFTDKYGNVNKKTAVVDWIDKEPPEIVLNGESQIILAKGDSYTEQGASATDNRDGIVDITISGDVDTSQSGTYYVRYSAIDRLGNASEVTRTVKVLESEYCITFKNYNGDILQNQNIRTNTMPEYTGETPVKPNDDRYTYVFSGWTPDITAVSGEATYTAQYTAVPRVYNVTFNADGGEIESPITEYTYGTGAQLPAPTRTGYTFNGWYDNAEFSGAVITSISEADTGDKAYYAKWTECEHNKCTETIIKGSTCTETGTKSLTCQDCNLVWTETIAKLQHTEVTDLRVEPTCTEKGKTEGSHCSVCGTVIIKQQVISPTGHTENSGDITKPPTCTETGRRTYQCTKCNEILRTEIISATGHHWGEWEITIPATEEAEGEKTHTCSKCEQTETTTIPILSHTHSMTKYEAVPSTCTQAGNIEYWTCAGCNKNFSDENGETEITDTTIPATGHTKVTDSRVEPTCTENGKTEGSHCDICGEIITEQQVIPAIGHSWGGWKILKEPTMTENGEAERVCLNDNMHQDTTEIPSLSDEAVWTKGNYTAPTEETQGSQEYISEYGTVIVAIPALPPSDRVKFTPLSNGSILAELIFNKTEVPENDDIWVFVAFKKDGILQSVQMPKLANFTTLFAIPDQFKDCDISVYVWDKNMTPLMEVQKVE